MVQRGGCAFETKARVAQAAGATALLVVNSQGGHDTLGMAFSRGSKVADITIPTVMVGRNDGDFLLRLVREAGREDRQRLVEPERPTVRLCAGGALTAAVSRAAAAQSGNVSHAGAGASAGSAGSAGSAAHAPKPMLPFPRLPFQPTLFLHGALVGGYDETHGLWQRRELGGRFAAAGATMAGGSAGATSAAAAAAAAAGVATDAKRRCSAARQQARLALASAPHAATDARELVRYLVHRHPCFVFGKTYCPITVQSKNALIGVGARCGVLNLDWPLAPQLQLERGLFEVGAGAAAKAVPAATATANASALAADATRQAAAGSANGTEAPNFNTTAAGEAGGRGGAAVYDSNGGGGGGGGVQAHGGPADTKLTGQQVQLALWQLTKRRTVPNIFVGGEPIGGGNELMVQLTQGRVGFMEKMRELGAFLRWPAAGDGVVDDCRAAEREAEAEAAKAKPVRAAKAPAVKQETDAQADASAPVGSPAWLRAHGATPAGTPPPGLMEAGMERRDADWFKVMQLSVEGAAAVVGERGLTVQHIERETGAALRVVKGDGTVSITGSEVEVSAAVAKVNAIVQQTGSGDVKVGAKAEPTRQAGAKVGAKPGAKVKPAREDSLEPTSNLHDRLRAAAKDRASPAGKKAAAQAKAAQVRAKADVKAKPVHKTAPSSGLEPASYPKERANNAACPKELRGTAECVEWLSQQQAGESDDGAATEVALNVSHNHSSTATPAGKNLTSATALAAPPVMTTAPTLAPTAVQTAEPTLAPTAVQTAGPTLAPTTLPTIVPIVEQTQEKKMNLKPAKQEAGEAGGEGKEGEEGAGEEGVGKEEEHKKKKHKKKMHTKKYGKEKAKQDKNGEQGEEELQGEEEGTAYSEAVAGAEVPAAGGGSGIGGGGGGSSSGGGGGGHGGGNVPLAREETLTEMQAAAARFARQGAASITALSISVAGKAVEWGQQAGVLAKEDGAGEGGAPALVGGATAGSSSSALGPAVDQVLVRLGFKLPLRPTVGLGIMAGTVNIPFRSASIKQCELRIANCELRIANCELRIALTPSTPASTTPSPMCDVQGCSSSLAVPASLASFGA
jgi:glutaredoxin-related protein